MRRRYARPRRRASWGWSATASSRPAPLPTSSFSTRSSRSCRPISPDSSSTHETPPALRPSKSPEGWVMKLVDRSANARGLQWSAAAAALAVVLAGPGCVDIVGADLGQFTDRDEKHFAVSGTPDVTVGTFDGSIEIRPWDKAEVEVVIEKRGRSKAVTDAIEVHSEHDG